MRLRYCEAELLADHDYAAPHQAAGYHLHGGFDAAGHYISPRSRHRGAAIEAWSQALVAQGHELIDASRRLLEHDSFPNADQHAWLIRHGIGHVLWDDLTITGVIEARGRALTDYVAPDFQELIIEDISDWATGHLNIGLLRAHGMDEGGDPASTLGGHDVMWFAARDLIFGADAYPLPPVPDSIGRPDTGRLMPDLPQSVEQSLLLLMNVLMIEVRAEAFFATVGDILARPGLAPKGDAAASLAGAMVGRIRQDEAFHVGYLQVVISELRSATFRISDGTKQGAEIIDPIWRGMVEWHAQTTRAFSEAQKRQSLEPLLVERGLDLSMFDKLSERRAA